MDLNKITLTPAALAELYGQTLVAIPDQPEIIKQETVEETPVEIQHNKETIRSLGNNEQQVLILVDQPDLAFLPDRELQFLTGILAACKLSLADIALVNLYHYPELPYRELLSHFRSRIVLLFGREPGSIGLPMNFPAYQLQAFAGNTFLHAPPLSALELDKVEKTKLWTALKRLFNI